MNWKVKADPIARRFGLYTAYTLDDSEFVGSVDKPANGVAAELKENQYEHLSLLEAAKKHPETGTVHSYALRKVDPDNPRKQYHVHLWGYVNGVTEIASHYEYRPDFRTVGNESLANMIERLRTHYRPEWGTDEYVQGKADRTVTTLIS